MTFNIKNNFRLFPFRNNIGCLGFLFGALIISIILFLGFFVGLFVLGLFSLFYIYKLFRNKMNRNNNLNNNNDSYTEAEYIEINDNEDTNK